MACNNLLSPIFNGIYMFCMAGSSFLSIIVGDNLLFAILDGSLAAIADGALLTNVSPLLSQPTTFSNSLYLFIVSLPKLHIYYRFLSAKKKHWIKYL